MKKKGITEFEKECIAINQDFEYGPEHFGPKWLIATELSEVEFISDYGNLIANSYSSYQLVPIEVGRTIMKHKNELERLKKRDIRHGCISYEACVEECMLMDSNEESQPEEFILGDEARIRDTKSLLIRRSFNELTDREKRYLIMHALRKKNCSEIAEAENVSEYTARYVIRNGRRKLAEQLNSTGYFRIDESHLPENRRRKNKKSNVRIPENAENRMFAGGNGNG